MNGYYDHVQAYFRHDVIVPGVGRTRVFTGEAYADSVGLRLENAEDVSTKATFVPWSNIDFVRVNERERVI